MNSREKSRHGSQEILVQQVRWQDGFPGTVEAFIGSPQFVWPATKDPVPIESISISGELAKPYVQIVDDLPLPPLSETDPGTNVKLNGLQKKQAAELFEHLTQSGITREEALAMMGPLAAEITKYRHSFSVSEARWTVRGLIGRQFLDRPFMESSIKS